MLCIDQRRTLARRTVSDGRPIRLAAALAATLALAVFGAAEAHAQLATGSYTGDGADNRAITGLGFQPDAVIIKGNTAQTAVIRTSTMTGDNTKPMVGATALTADLIQSLDAGGFTIGTDARVNSGGVTYYWAAF